MSEKATSGDELVIPWYGDQWYAGLCANCVFRPVDGEIEGVGLCDSCTAEFRADPAAFNAQFLPLDAVVTFPAQRTEEA